MVTPNPSLNETSQNLKFDIDQIYTDFIKEIDANRSLSNVNIQVDKNTLNSFDIDTIAGINKSLKIEDTPQESRLHCFLRLIGFPVVGNGDRFYNPGHDVMDGVKSMPLTEKINIANSPLQGFKEFSAKRENYVNDIKAIWEVRPVTITASALAVSSSLNIRLFSVPVDKSVDAFDFEIKNQSYVCELKSVVGEHKVNLSEYVDSLGNSPDKSKLFPTRYHYIKPLIVDPRIDFSCNPASRKVAVPFVFDKTKLLVSENTFVKRPLIEKIIRERFDSRNQKDITSSQSNLKNEILSIPTITDKKLIEQVSNDLYGLDDKIQFQKYLFIIAAMCKELVQAQVDIQATQALYYWVPAVSTSGPEGGSQVTPIIITSKLPTGDNNNFVTAADKETINATLAQAANQFNAQTMKTKEPDLGGTAFDKFSTTWGDDTSKGMGDLTKESLDSSNKQRDHDLSIANSALRTIEIIMGEFSGLGLCDIIAIIGALYVMPRKDLVGFLDDDAYSRMIVSLNLDLAALSGSDPDLPSTRVSISNAHASLMKNMKNFYNLMDDIYKQLSKNNGLST